MAATGASHVCVHTLLLAVAADGVRCLPRVLCRVLCSLHLQHRPVLASAVVVVLGLLLSFTGFLLLMALEYMPDLPSRCAASAGLCDLF